MPTATPAAATLTSLRQRALQYLARREYSRQELQRKLQHASAGAGETRGADADAAVTDGSVPATTLTALLDELEGRGLLSDARYAEMRARTRGQRYGNQRLRQELRQQAVAPELIEAALAECGSELERARQQWQKKFGTLPASTPELARQQRFLAYRGFSSAIIRSVLDAAGSDPANFSENSDADDDC